MNRCVIGIAIVGALAASACKKPNGTTGTGSGSTQAGSGSARPAGAGPVPAPLDPAALDNALKAKGFAPADVKKRVQGPHSGWAVVATKKDATTGDATEYDVVRVRAEGVAELRLVPPTASDPPTFSEVTSLEVRDLDGDGSDEAMLVVGWSRETKVPGAKGCEGCFVMTDEQAKQLYVLADAENTITSAFTHVVSYQSKSEGMPEDNPTPYAGPEDIEYDWKVVDGKPAVMKLHRTKNEVAPSDRLKGALDPASDALFAAGEGKDVSL